MSFASGPLLLRELRKRGRKRGVRGRRGHRLESERYARLLQPLPLEEGSDGVRGPDTAPQRSKCWLYPSEFLRLINCADVPRRRRRVYAAAVYLYARLNELRAIGLDDVDPEHGLVHVHRALDRQTGEEKTTKSCNARRVTVEPNILPVVRVLYDEATAEGEDRLLSLAQIDWAERLRADLVTAGVDRGELFADDKTRRPLRFHDLRATGITWAGIRGDDPLKIRQRAGHAKFSTTELYLRTAEVVGSGFGAPFPPLPDDLLLPADDAPPPTAVEPRQARRRGRRGRRGGSDGGAQSSGESSAKSSERVHRFGGPG
jgi:integrase